jgi:hypothetical protein
MPKQARTFVVTLDMRQRIREEVARIMHGQRPGVRGLRIPPYLGGDGVPAWHRARSTEILLNRVDPGIDRAPKDEE